MQPLDPSSGPPAAPSGDSRPGATIAPVALPGAWEDFVQHLQGERRLSPATVEAYQRDLFFFVAYLNERYDVAQLHEIQTLHVRSWLAEAAESGLTARTLNRRLSVLRTFFMYAQSRWDSVPQPAALLRGLKVPKRVIRVLRKDEVHDLLHPARFPDGWKGERDRFLLLTLYVLGIRRAELLGLKWSDVDPSSRSVRVVGKGDKQRVLPALDVWLDALRDFKEVSEREGVSTESWIFWEHPKKKLTQKGVYSIVHSYLQGASSVEKASPHVMRHTFATHLLDMGADLASIRSLLGHANLSATQVYTHASIEQLKSVVQRAHPRGREGERP